MKIIKIEPFKIETLWSNGDIRLVDFTNKISLFSENERYKPLLNFEIFHSVNNPLQNTKLAKKKEMAKIKLIIYNDLGEEIGVREKILESGIETLDEIESSVELFRQSMLPEITKVLLEDKQSIFKKK